jgi:CRP/FNR family transcriptional regulator, cyclic AMP receptor protein
MIVGVGVPGSADELAATSLFARVERALLAPLEAAAHVRRLGRGQVLFVTGEPADHLFVVRRGRLKVSVTSERGTELVLSVARPGDTLGDVSVIDGGPRSADVLATEASELLAVPVAVVDAMLRANPPALRAVAEGLAAGMRRLTEQAADLVFLDLPRRLVKLLLDRGADAPAAGGAVVAVAASQSELAAMLGVTRQSVNRSLSSLARRGWVEVEDDGIRLLDVPSLSRFARS